MLRFPDGANDHLKTIVVVTRDVRRSKFVGTGKERNAFPFKKDLSLSHFFRFFSFLERVFPLFPIFLGLSHPVLRYSFPVFSSFHLSKPVPGFLMGLKLAILERVLNENLCKPIPRRSSNRSSPFLKSFLVFPQPVFLVIRKNESQERPQTLKAIHWPAFNEVLYLSTISVLYYKVL